MSDPQTNKQLAVIARLNALIERQADHMYEAKSIQGELRALRLFMIETSYQNDLRALKEHMIEASDPMQAEIDRLASKGQKIYKDLPPIHPLTGQQLSPDVYEAREEAKLTRREQALANLAASDDEKAARRQSFRDGPVEPMDLDKLNNLPHVMPEMHEGWDGNIPTGTGGNMVVNPTPSEFPWKMTPEPTVADHIDDELKRPRVRKTPWWKRG